METLSAPLSSPEWSLALVWAVIWQPGVEGTVRSSGEARFTGKDAEVQ